MYIYIQGMSSLRSLIPFSLSHLLETSAYVFIKLYTPDPPRIQYCMLIYLTRNFILLKNSRSPVDQYMRMRSSVPLGPRAHPG